VASGSVDPVCCFKTLEHLYDDEIASFLADADRVLVTRREILISVPVIGGPTLLLKEANRGSCSGAAATTRRMTCWRLNSQVFARLRRRG